MKFFDRFVLLLMSYTDKFFMLLPAFDTGTPDLDHEYTRNGFHIPKNPITCMTSG
jgi:hypothetical protein